MFDLIYISGVDSHQLRIKVFPLSLANDAKEWWISEGDGKITRWEELVEKFFCRFYPESYDEEDEMLDEAFDVRNTEKQNGQGQTKHKNKDNDDKQPNKRRCKAEKFEAVKYSLGPNEEYIAIRSYEYDIWERNKDNLSIIYQDIFKKKDEGWRVTHSKRHAFWSFNEDILKIVILKTNTPYPSRRYGVSVPAFTKRPQRNKDQYAVSRRLNTPYSRYGINIIFLKISNVVPTPRNPQYALAGDLDNSTNNVLIPLDSWTSGLLVYRLPLSEFKTKKPEESLLNWKPLPSDWATTSKPKEVQDYTPEDNMYRYSRKGFLEDDDSSDDSIFIVDPGWDDYCLQELKLNRPVPCCPDARRARM
ncbi:hypothetical protein Tco_0733111 [Tanacetum coccineum]